MRFLISLKVADSPAILPINYQYPMSVWLQRTLHSSCIDLAAFLQKQGFAWGEQRFRTFTFSWLNVPERKINGDRLEVLCEHVNLQLGIFLDDSVEHPLMNCFQDQKACIGDLKSKVNFTVIKIQRLKDPDFHGDLTLQTSSPLVLTSRDLPTKNKAEFLHPRDPHYEEIFFNKLLHRYITGQKGGPVSEDAWDSRHDFKFQVLDNPKSRFVTIKSNMPGEEKIRGYTFTFRVRAPEPLLRFGWHAGFGERTCNGFGMCDLS